MADEGEHLVEVPTGGGNAVKWVVSLLAVMYVAGSLYFLFNLRERIDQQGKDQAASNAQITELGKRMQSAEADSETLAKQLGMTKKELADRSAALQREQVAQRASQERLAEEQKQQLTQVNGEVANVKTDVGGVKTDVASTKAELAAADLEVLKHKGDRNYYEFTLVKGAKPQPVSTVSLQLKKTDAKRGKFTINVTSDDKTIEKKDRNVSEPIQFYSGRDHLLYEMVVWTVDKKQAVGYLSTPKNAPVPVTTTPAGQ
jgi:hypothetical protein